MAVGGGDVSGMLPSEVGGVIYTNRIPDTYTNVGGKDSPDYVL